MTNERINNYCTEQNIVVRYPNGAGGKFFITCLFLFDHVAHWDKSVQDGKRSHMDWFKSAWPNDISQWSIHEPNIPWDTMFFSRRFPRNNNITCDEFNQLVTDHASDYFFECWNNGLKITDHFHKKTRTQFHELADLIEITLPNNHSVELYKEMVKQKLWLWDEETKTVISTLDHPDYCHDNTNLKHKLEWKNKDTFTNYNTFDDFFYDVLIRYNTIGPFVKTDPDPSAIVSFDFAYLYQFESLLSVIEKLETYYNQKVDYDKLRQMHTIWREKSRI